MDKPRECGCKGCRTCLICEKVYGIEPKTYFTNAHENSYTFCPYCNKTWNGWKFDDFKSHPNHEGKMFPYSGIYIKLDFLTEYEEDVLLKGIDDMPWDLSQSGRRKQNFGPKCNFKRRKLRQGEFRGFPKFSQFVQEKFKGVSILEDFQTIEQCSLEYDPARGASIDPHIDDCWIWGERIVTVNLLSDSVLTMTYNLKLDKYNLDCVKTYPSVLTKNGDKNNSGDHYSLQKEVTKDWPIVRIPMPRRSLLVMFGSARYDWEHRILREDIVSRRVCLAYREFTPPFLSGGTHHNDGRTVLEVAKNFF